MKRRCRQPSQAAGEVSRRSPCAGKDREHPAPEAGGAAAPLHSCRVEALQHTLEDGLAVSYEVK